MRCACRNSTPSAGTAVPAEFRAGLRDQILLPVRRAHYPDTDYLILGQKLRGWAHDISNEAPGCPALGPTAREAGCARRPGYCSDNPRQGVFKGRCHPGAQGERVLRFDGEDFDLARHRQAQLAAKGQGLADAQEVRAGPREPAQGGCVQFMDETGAGTPGLNGIHDEGRR